MGIWGLDIYDDDLAMDIKEEFESYLNEGMDEDDAIEAVIFNNDNFLGEIEDLGTFTLTLGVLVKENEINNKKVIKLLKDLKKNQEYWEYLKENSIELYEARMDLLRELI